MEQEIDPIRDAVQKHYAVIAEEGSSCCGDSACCSTDFYNPTELVDLPQDVSQFTLGCGNPFSQAELQPGESVLDLGSGGGLDCFIAARQVGAAGRVIGIDMTPQMIERARSAAEKLGLEQVEFRQGYLEDLPVESSTIDVILSNCVINLSPDKRRVFAEMFRVLRPGGRVAVSDIVTNGPMPEYLRQDQQAWSACVSGAIPQEQYAQELREAGFSQVEVEPKEVFITPEVKQQLGLPYSALIRARKPAA
jgi:arsenite methyltransferase